MLRHTIARFASRLSNPELHSGIYEFADKTYTSENHVLADVIRDVELSKHSVLVICDSCNVDHATPELRHKITDALKAAKLRRVDVCLLIHSEPPTLFQDLADQGLLRIRYLEEPRGFSSRLVDNVRYHQHTKGEICAPGTSLVADLAFTSSFPGH